MAAGDDYMASPPAGQSRFEATDTTVSLYFGIIGAVTALAFVALSLRLFTTLNVSGRRLGVDEYLIILAFLTTIAVVGIHIKLVQYGFGHHFWQVTSDQYYNFNKVNAVSQILASFSIVAPKLSLLFFYLRLTPKPLFRIAVYILMVVVVLYWVLNVVLGVFGCIPIEAAFDANIAKIAKCVDKAAFFMVFSIGNSVIDFALLLLPVYLVYPLQMNLRKKIGVWMMFATGLFTCAVSIRRTVLLTESLPDKTYQIDNHIWAAVEFEAGIICASIPTLKPLVKRYLPKLLDYATLRTFTSYSSTVARNRKRRSEYGHPLAPDQPQYELSDNSAKSYSRSILVNKDKEMQSRYSEMHGWSSPPATYGSESNPLVGMVEERDTFARAQEDYSSTFRRLHGEQHPTQPPPRAKLQIRKDVMFGFSH